MLTLNERSIDWALKHATEFGDTDVLPAPFEYQALNCDFTLVKTHLMASDILDWKTRPHRSLLSPKAKFAFRIITQLDPLDFLVYAACIYELANDIENRRVPTSLNRVYSYRLKPNRDGSLFDETIGYRQFLDESRSKIASRGSNCFVATADISDFYQRIYHHRLENALRSATSKTNHVKAIMGLLSSWNGTESFGIPVGCAPSRALAEITLSDIDEALLAYGVDYIRFNDDFRIFCDSKKQAYQNIALLADLLYKNHGLTLQPQKTNIYECSDFVSKFLTTPLDRELNSLHNKFQELANSIGLSNWYEPISPDELTQDQLTKLGELNLVELFNEECSKLEPDLPVIRFCLRRLGQIGNSEVIETIFNNIESLLSAFADIVKYFKNLRDLDPAGKSELGSRLLELMSDSIISELTYHKIWILSVFTQSMEWDNEHRFIALYNSSLEPACRRELILALGRSNQRHWFQSQWRTLFDHPHWERRAVIAAASCMPPDARKHWYQHIESQLDPLELAVMRWARQNPFST